MTCCAICVYTHICTTTTNNNNNIDKRVLIWFPFQPKEEECHFGSSKNKLLVVYRFTTILIFIYLFWYFVFLEEENKENAKTDVDSGAIKPDGYFQSYYYYYYYNRLSFLGEKKQRGRVYTQSLNNWLVFFCFSPSSFIGFIILIREKGHGGIILYWFHSFAQFRMMAIDLFLRVKPKFFCFFDFVFHLSFQLLSTRIQMGMIIKILLDW